MIKLILFIMLLFTFLQATYIKTNGTVTDTETGLMWQDNYTDNDGNVKHANWYNAISYCNDLEAYGYDDWRLPNVNELASITDITKGTEPDTIGDVRAISDVFDLTLFSTLQDVPWFWSSTTHASNIMVAWGVCFLDGHISPHDKIETDDRYRHVRCVRDQGGNTPPVADAGPDQNGVTGTLVTLDGSGSSDADSDTLTYNWSFTSRPAGSTAVLTNPTAVNPTFTPDVNGSYVVQLIVNDGTVDSVPDSVTVTASTTPPVNTPPTADAGSAQNVETGTLTTLDGSASSDADNDPLTYNWSFTSRPAGSTAVLTNPTAVNPTFTPDVNGSYVVQLIVNDGTVDSAPDSVTVTASTTPPVNTPPTADAGPDKTVQVNHTVTISGSGSDSDGTIVAYRWVKQSTGQVLANTATFNFTPTGTRTKTLVLTVTDDDGATASDTMILTVTESPVGNTPPVADAGPDQNGVTGTLVTLDGSGSSDADNDPLTYNWSFTSRPAGSTAVLTNPTAVNPTFTPDVNGSYVVQLIVNDGTVDSVDDSMTVIVGEIPPANTPPTANAGPDKTVQVNHTVTISGSGSDSDGSIVAYEWIKQSTGQRLATTPTFNFTPTGTRTKTLVLTVTDDDGATASDTMILTVTEGPVGNTPPVADAGPDQNGVAGTLVTLDGSGSSDADSDTLTYNWSFTSRPAGSTAVLTNPTAVNPTFTPDIDGEYVVQLIVNDGTVDSVDDSMTVIVGEIPPANTPPTADAGPDKTVQVNHTVTISGSGSDSDGTIVAYEWIKQSTGQRLATTPTFNFTPTGTRTKTLVLTVTDNDGATASDEMILTVTDGPVGNIPPTADAGPDKTVQVNNTVTISGSGSDSDGSIVAYQWIKQSTGQVLANTATFNFTPTGTRTKTLVLTVTDDDGATASDTMILTVTGN